jgi:predicted membrane-bound spermidine synthase
MDVQSDSIVDLDLPMRKLLVVAGFGIPAVLIGLLNLVFPTGGAAILEPRDILVTLGAVLGGPLVGAAIGFVAGIPAAPSLIEFTTFIAGGILVGIAAEYCLLKKVWMPYAALGMGIAYLLTAFLMVFFLSREEDLPSLAFRSLFLLTINIGILAALSFKAPGVFSWARKPGLVSPPSIITECETDHEETNAPEQGTLAE